MAIEQKYTVSVVTGNETGAGTDSKVSITIFGEKADSGVKPLAGAKDAFEKYLFTFFSHIHFFIEEKQILSLLLFLTLANSKRSILAPMHQDLAQTGT